MKPLKLHPFLARMVSRKQCYIPGGRAIINPHKPRGGKDGGPHMSRLWSHRVHQGPHCLPIPFNGLAPDKTGWV